jgi:hypothetical protein
MITQRDLVCSNRSPQLSAEAVSREFLAACSDRGALTSSNAEPRRRPTALADWAKTLTQVGAGHLVVGDLRGQPNQLVAFHAHTTSYPRSDSAGHDSDTRAASTAAKYSSESETERCPATLSPGVRGRSRLGNAPARSSGRRGRRFKSCHPDQ